MSLNFAVPSAKFISVAVALAGASKLFFGNDEGLRHADEGFMVASLVTDIFKTRTRARLTVSLTKSSTVWSFLLMVAAAVSVSVSLHWPSTWKAVMAASRRG